MIARTIAVLALLVAYAVFALVYALVELGTATVVKWAFGYDMPHWMFGIAVIIAISVWFVTSAEVTTEDGGDDQ